MATYSRTFAHIRRQKAADYRRRKKAAQLGTRPKPQQRLQGGQP
jgi:hypothetical protein